MSRYIDADRIDWRLIIPTNATTAEENMIYRARRLIDYQPTADVVEVVRCKDCRWYDGNECFEDGLVYPNENDFCSYGERRENEV